MTDTEPDVAPKNVIQAIAAVIADEPATAPAPVASEKAPVLTANGAATSDTARLKWTDGKPDAGETISVYVVQQKVVGSTWSTVTESPAAASPLSVGGLTANTAYLFHVRAEYASGADGPWSGELAVKTADRVLLRTEQRDLMGADGHVWTFTEGAEPLLERINPLSPPSAKALFMARFDELTIGWAPF